MKNIDKKDLKEIIQSGHINLLIGSGCSSDYIPTLGDVENRMNDDSTKDGAQRDYYEIIKKSKAIINELLETDSVEKQNLTNAKEKYDNFLTFWAKTISSRSLQILNKQVNIFTTNFDLLIEDSCERLSIPYNDGFIGQINRLFNVANYNKIQKFKSLQFDNTSDIPLFNIIKLHGSVSWKTVEENVVYSDGSHIPEDLLEKRDEEFEQGYKKIAVINPNAEKHFETVLDTNYASMLRKFTLELEKENSVLVIVGFSLADKHIRNLMYGALKTNPTLIVIFFSFSSYDENLDKHEEKKHPNLFVISPEDNFSFDKTTKYFESIFNDDNGQDQNGNEE